MVAERSTGTRGSVRVRPFDDAADELFSSAVSKASQRLIPPSTFWSRARSFVFLILQALELSLGHFPVLLDERLDSSSRDHRSGPAGGRDRAGGGSESWRKVWSWGDWARVGCVKESGSFGTEASGIASAAGGGTSVAAAWALFWTGGGAGLLRVSLWRSRRHGLRNSLCPGAPHHPPAHQGHSGEHDRHFEPGRDSESRLFSRNFPGLFDDGDDKLRRDLGSGPHDAPPSRCTG